MKIRLNENFSNLKESYLFSDIAKRIRAYSAEHPEKAGRLIRLGIGDVTLPLTPTVIAAMHRATDEMADKSTFRGYAPEYGYDFLRQAIADHYATLGAEISPAEIFAGDGAKSDLGNLVDILGDNEILIPDPVYPVYMDSNLMSGRHITFLPADAQNRYLPLPDRKTLTGEGYVIYLCSPNNPTGAVYDREGLRAWVNFACETGSLIIFDSAYEAYIRDDSPHTIFTVEGARECAVEVCSLSKSAGFTGTRCGWTVIPAGLKAGDTPLCRMWERRQATKFNGIPYVVQRAAEAALSPEGWKENMESVSYYMENARMLTDLLQEKGIEFTGGISSPYLWLRCPWGLSSWDFFDRLLQDVQIVGTPGEGFGEHGKGYFRLTAFGSRENTREAVRRLREWL